jgi:hypothetical protein
MQIFGFSTYHRFLVWALPILIVYSALLGFLLDWFGLNRGFFWHVGISIVFLLRGYVKQNASIKMLIRTTDDPEELRLINESGVQTLRNYVLSSIVYVVTFGISFLGFNKIN